MNKKEAFAYARRHGILVTEEEAAQWAADYMEQGNNSLEPISFAEIASRGLGIYLRNPKFREELRRQKNIILPLIDMAKSCAVLYLDTKATAEEILQVSSKLERDLSKHDFLGSNILLANDEAITKNQYLLQTRGFQFFENWQNPNSQHKKLLRAAEKYGKVYQMGFNGRRWTYGERLSSPQL